MGTEPENGISVTFTGKRGALFWLALKTGFFTILTLGFYRFWMKTRLRRWYWSAMRPGGHPLEYVGDPLEKLLGFFIAVVILTFYIGIVNLLLMFVSFSVFNSSVLGYVLSFAGVIPIWFYARYRARRYVLARTRWRGVRFGLEKGAWGYALRALWYWFVTIVTLGILWPRMTFLLEKYKTDRTFYGSARLLQGGNWQMLYRATIPLVLSLLLLAGAALWTFWWDPVLADLSDSSLIFPAIEDLFEGGSLATAWHDPERLLLFPLALSGMVFGAIYYRWVSKRIMANHKIGPGIQFASALSGARVTFIYVLGNFIAYTMLVLGVLALVLLAILMFAGPDSLASNNYLGMDVLQDMPSWLSFVLLAILYLTFFLMWGVLYNTFVTFPLMRHMARTTSLPLIAGLPLISQRTRDEFAEAEGFAEALDLGAAI
ncbi:Membrane protein [Sulfitobacter noctilucicola]|nr:Membrane protein [Sulfitobacter noctilucicola]